MSLFAGDFGTWALSAGDLYQRCTFTGGCLSDHPSGSHLMVKMTLWYKGIRMLVPQSHPSSCPLSLSHHDIHVNGSLWYGQHLLTNPSVTLGRKFQGWQREQTGTHDISSQEKDTPSRYVTSHGNASFTRSEPQGPSIPKSSPLLSTLTKVLTAWRNAMVTTKEKKQKTRATAIEEEEQISSIFHRIQLPFLVIYLYS